MKKTAFTLAELLIVMTLIGVLAIILLPNTKTLMPNKSMTMFKKAYAITGQITNNLLDDEDLYPEKEGDDNNFIANFGNTDAATYRTTERSGPSKFCWLFAEMLNISTDIKCGDVAKAKFTNGALPQGHFTTTDGIVWILPISDFADDNPKEIYIDINGDEKPNQFVDSTCTASNTDGSSKCRGMEPDRFVIKMDRTGKLSLDSDDERFYLKTESSSAKYYAGKQK